MEKITKKVQKKPYQIRSGISRQHFPKIYRKYVRIDEQNMA